MAAAQRLTLKPLEEPYRGRAVPPGTTRYWSWLFAASEIRDPLLAMHALAAEWRALLDPGTDASVARIKLTWWHDEIARLVAGAPLHPVTRYIAALPRAVTSNLVPLQRVVAAAATQSTGVPLEHAAELEIHADDLYGIPLRVASQLADPAADSASLRPCTAALAAAQYLSRAVADYRREAHAGRVLFPVDALLAAEIENEDLCAPLPPPRLHAYLEQLRGEAAGYFAAAARAIASVPIPHRRHLTVLVTLGAKHLQSRKNPGNADFPLADLYNAWNAARRATAR